MAEQVQGEGRVVFSRPKALLPVVTNYCPGCPHGIVHRLVSEVIDELDIEGRTVGVAPVGCAVTSPDPYGRDVSTAGYPVRVCELLSSLDGPAYLERVTVDTPKHVRQAKRAIKKAFQNQIDGIGYSLVEVVSTCPTNWGLTPQDSFEWMRENMLPYYPLGVYRDVVADGFADAAQAAAARNADCPVAHPEKFAEAKEGAR